MQVGSLYTCKWKSKSRAFLGQDRGWDLLLFLRAEGNRYYHFYDVVHGQKRILDEGIIKYCKEITKETTCTQ